MQHSSREMFVEAYRMENDLGGHCLYRCELRSGAVDGCKGVKERGLKVGIVGTPALGVSQFRREDVSTKRLGLLQEYLHLFFTGPVWCNENP